MSLNNFVYALACVVVCVCVMCSVVPRFTNIMVGVTLKADTELTSVTQTCTLSDGAMQREERPTSAYIYPRKQLS